VVGSLARWRPERFDTDKGVTGWLSQAYSSFGYHCPSSFDLGLDGLGSNHWAKNDQRNAFSTGGHLSHFQSVLGRELLGETSNRLGERVAEIGFLHVLAILMGECWISI
jgi:hypothetical protein